jgi:phosphodiesterase/alkaline phosphatase D-like protein
VLPFALVVVLLVALAGAAGSAFAIPVGHGYAFSFGESGTHGGQLRVEFSGMGMDVDESTGDVYVADTSNFRVQKFDENGNFILTWGFGVKNGADEFQVCRAPETCHEGLFGNAPGQFQNPMSVAVDNSAGPNAGDVYVVDSDSPCCAPGGGRQVILKYSSEGQYLGTITGEGSPGGHFYKLPWRRGVSVDDQGFVWVFDGIGFESTTPRVLKFSNQASNAYVPGSEWIPTQSPYGSPEQGYSWEFDVAADGSHVYLMGMAQECEWVYRLSADGSISQPLLRIPACFGGGSDLAVDPANEHVFFNREDRVQEYIDNGAGVETVGPDFGSDQLNEVQGLTVNGATGAVYAGDPSQAKVFVFKQLRVPEVVTGEPTNVLHTTATFTGHTAPDPDEGGPVTDCHFEYGQTTSYGSTIPCAPATPYAGSTAVTADVTGLTPDVAYHYRLVASNSIGPNRGADKTFTPKAVLDTTTGAPSDVAPISATLNGSFTGDNNDTHYYFEWGHDTSYGNTTPAVPGADAGSTTGTTPVSAEISGLTEYSFYHYRLVTTNSIGTSHGVDRSFYSAPPIVPDVEGTAASGITPTSATISAQINPGYGMTIYNVEYGTSASYDRHTAPGTPLDPDNVLHPVSQTLTGLAPATTYHYQLVAVNFGGVSHTADRTFTTPDAPVIGSTSSSGVDSRSATLEATITPNLSPTTYHFEYGTDGSYGSRTAQSASIGTGPGDTVATAQISGLAPGTTYHFRAVATNGIGTTPGRDQTLTTSPPPAAAAGPPPTPQRCRTGFVRKHGKCVGKRRHGRRHRRHMGGRGNG